MADIKVSAMTALVGAIADGDGFLIIDDMSGTPLSRKCTIQNIRTYMLSGITSGYVPYYNGTAIVTSVMYQTSSKISVFSTDVNASFNIGADGATYNDTLLLRATTPTIYFNTDNLSRNFRMSANRTTDFITMAYGGTDTNAVDDSYTVMFRMGVRGIVLGTGADPSGGGVPIIVMTQATGDPTGIGSNTAGLIAKDSAGTCELYAWDEAGNVTPISPHSSLEEAEAAGIVIEPDDLAPAVQDIFNTYTRIHSYRYLGPSGQWQVKQRHEDGETDIEKIFEDAQVRWDANQDRIEDEHTLAVQAYYENQQQWADYEAKVTAIRQNDLGLDPVTLAVQIESVAKPQEVAQPEPFVRKHHPRWR